MVGSSLFALLVVVAAMVAEAIVSVASGSSVGVFVGLGFVVLVGCTVTVAGSGAFVAVVAGIGMFVEMACPPEGGVAVCDS